MNTSDYNLPLFPKEEYLSGCDPFYYESVARKGGYQLIAGVDEVGRGPLAGPVVAAAVILPDDVTLPGVKDSKQLKENIREQAFPVINKKALTVSVGVVSHTRIDKINILNASLEAMKLAIKTLDPAPDYVLVDGIHKVPISIPQKCLKKGDQLSQSISAASIIAKVYRDRIMYSYHELFPEYGLSQNKGYGTALHRDALMRYGPTPIHRLSFKGVC